METIIIIIIAITLLLLIGVSIRANKAKKEGVDPISPAEVAKEEEPTETVDKESHKS